LLFFGLDDDQARHIRDLLNFFEKGTGQCLSPAKCSLLVRDGADQDVVDRIKAILNVNRAEFEAKYLGLPMPEGRLTGGVFKSIEERYVKRMTDWRERTLPQMAKEVPYLRWLKKCLLNRLHKHCQHT
jgi:hypothetical protein